MTLVATRSLGQHHHLCKQSDIVLRHFTLERLALIITLEGVWRVEPEIGRNDALRRFANVIRFWRREERR